VIDQLKRVGRPDAQQPSISRTTSVETRRSRHEVEESPDEVASNESSLITYVTRCRKSTIVRNIVTFDGARMASTLNIASLNAAALNLSNAVVVR